MAHTYVSALVHVVFSTKGRRKTISAQLQPKLWAYLGGPSGRPRWNSVQATRRKAKRVYNPARFRSQKGNVG